MLKINKQEMTYSCLESNVKIYQKDKEGNIIYYDVDGEKIPMIEKEIDGFAKPKTFYASINNKLSEVLMKEFGVDDSTNYAQIVTDKGYLPIKAGDLIWKRSEVKYDSDGFPDPKSADYTVKGVADEGLTVDLFLLQRNVK